MRGSGCKVHTWTGFQVCITTAFARLFCTSATVSYSKMANSFCNVAPHNMKFLKRLSCSGLNASSIPILKDPFKNSQWFKAQLEKFCLGLKLGTSVRIHNNYFCFMTCKGKSVGPSLNCSPKGQGREQQGQDRGCPSAELNSYSHRQ